MIQLRQVYLDKLKEDVKSQIKVREDAEEKRETQRDVLTEAVKKTKIIEKDKDKTKISWKKWMGKEEAKFLDDISTIGYERKRRQAEDNA